MRTRAIGGDLVSVIGYGAWEVGGDMWGPNEGEDEAVAAIRAALDAGMTWVDTAEVYGKGRSEQIVGKALEGRDDVFVATKIGNRSGFHAEGVRKGAHGSLKRLGRDVIDLYQVHWRPSRVSIEETWEAMARLVDDGLVRHIGVSNFDRKDIERCESIRHVDSLQNEYSMLHREDGDALFPWCAENGTAVIAYGPLAYGLLSGAIGMDTEFHPEDWRSGRTRMGYYRKLFEPKARARHLHTIDRLRPIAERLGATMSQLALAWVVSQPGVTLAIAGSRNPKHLAENAGAGDLELDEATLKEIDQILTG